MDSDPKKSESDDDQQTTPSFEEVVRKMLNTPPKPKKGSRVEKSADKSQPKPIKNGDR